MMDEQPKQEEPWWMFFLWPWSETYGAGPTANFIGRIGYGFFIILGLAVGINALVQAF